MNALNLLFLAPIVILGVAAAAHATAYLHGEARQHQPRFWFFFILTLVSMSGVVLSPGKLTFLLAWEAMGLASAGLVAFENTEKSVRKATWIYFLACHAGACALMLAGVFLNKPNCTLVAFICAVIGFGLKIGFPPFHVWLPEAHPAAPAPASAIMSGAMIPLGFYGLIRFVTPWGENPQIWGQTPEMFAISGWILLILGALGALGGILFALPQVNLKKLLAFSSVENMGVIAMGLGLALLGTDPRFDNQNNELNGIFSFIKATAFAGVLAHILNHAFLKGALFLGAGSVLRQTGTLDQDKLGGLMKRMPKTGTLFVLNALGLSGLPPLNGFLSELLIYSAAFTAVKSQQPGLMAAGFLVLVALSLTGGLAAAAYCKAIGATFLGEPRSYAAEKAVETPKRMWGAQLALFACSIVMILLCGAAGVRALPSSVVLTAVCAGGVFILLTAALVALRRFLCPRGQEKPLRPTWDCGYHEPTARMAYTATAFTQPIVDLCSSILKPRHHLIPFTGHPATPTDAAFVTETDDRALSCLWHPVFTWFARLFQRAHLLQNGSLHFYIFVVILGVLALLVAAMM